MCNIFTKAFENNTTKHKLEITYFSIEILRKIFQNNHTKIEIRDLKYIPHEFKTYSILCDCLGNKNFYFSGNTTYYERCDDQLPIMLFYNSDKRNLACEELAKLCDTPVELIKQLVYVGRIEHKPNSFCWAHSFEYYE